MKISVPLPELTVGESLMILPLLRQSVIVNSEKFFKMSHTGFCLSVRSHNLILGCLTVQIKNLCPCNIQYFCL